MTWIESNFTRTVGPDFLFPDVMGFRLERAYKYADVVRTNARIRVPGMSRKQWAITARQQEELAIEAADQGNKETAAAFFYRASIYYGRAAWGILAVDTHKRRLQEKCTECFAKYAAGSDGLASTVELETSFGPVAGVLYLPPGDDGGLPGAIHFPGTDMFKEEFPNPYDNLFTQRGIAVLSIDGPGQGETRVNGITLTAARYDEAASAAVDYLASHPRVDAERIFTTGSSMGSHWSLRAAAADVRVKVASGYMGVVYDLPTMLATAPPGFSRRLEFMTGLTGTEFTAAIQASTLIGYEDKVTVPTLLTTGEFDELCPLADADALFEALTCPRELWVVEDEAHPIGGRASDLLPCLVDWSKNNLDKPVSDDHAKRRVIPPR